jgi:hypothetical protein
LEVGTYFKVVWYIFISNIQVASIIIFVTFFIKIRTFRLAAVFRVLIHELARIGVTFRFLIVILFMTVFTGLLIFFTIAATFLVFFRDSMNRPA